MGWRFFGYKSGLAVPPLWDGEAVLALRVKIGL